MEITPEILSKLEQLEQKYTAMGQDMPSYLDGLLYSNVLNYWDYVKLDTLLSLQYPRTDFPDEVVFIIYHQITELYFRLILTEQEQLRNDASADLATWKKRLRRMITYLGNLSQSFDVMIEGMDPQQFLKFRMSLLPASGFQSAQYRMIEIASTPLHNLVKVERRSQFKPETPLVETYEAIYWKEGNLELKTGKKTLTLTQFEKKYDQRLLSLAQELASSNIWVQYRELPQADQDDQQLKEMLREFDLYANVFWPLSHYKSAVRYLQGDPEVIAATGGTNWQKFLPPRFQKVIFFPELWTEQEKDEWGKAWVLNLFKEKVENQWGKLKH
jgi:tryptophan 2,3-dioxygenase